jgi:hypothetical protein
LTIWANTTVVKVILDDQRASGVQLRDGKHG